MTDHDFRHFGDRKTFSIEARLITDPDPSGAATDDAWSYGELRIFVRDRCLTRHTVPTGIRNEVRWYLAPMFRWLSDAWLPLFHEQQPPFLAGSHEHFIVRFEQGERLLLDDESPAASLRRGEMQAWRKRHALWSAAAGGVLPNIWFRRQSDQCEIAYDPGVTIGAPRHFEFQFARGTALLDLDAVSDAFWGFLKWGVATGSRAGSTIALPDQTMRAARKAET